MILLLLSYKAIRDRQTECRLYEMRLPRAVLAQKFWGGGVTPISPFITEYIVSVLRNRKNTNFI